MPVRRFRFAQGSNQGSFVCCLICSDVQQRECFSALSGIGLPTKDQDKTYVLDRLTYVLDRLTHHDRDRITVFLVAWFVLAISGSRTRMDEQRRTAMVLACWLSYMLVHWQQLRPADSRGFTIQWIDYWRCTGFYKDEDR